MSQSPSSKNSSPISETASGSRAPNAVSDQDVVLDVVPLNSVPPSDSARSQPRKMHARKSTGGSVPETFSVQGREGSSYVHNAIANLVTRILNEGRKVEGISVPLAQMPASNEDQGVQDDEIPVDKDVKTTVDNDETSAEKNDETPVTKDVETSVTPLKTVTKDKMKKVPTGPSKSGSKVSVKKRKERSISDSETDVPSDVPDIPSKKKIAVTKSATKLIKTAGLIKTVSQFSKCYEMLVKEFIVNLSQDCADGRTDDFHKVYVRRKCIEFSPAVINHYLGRNAEAQPELEVTDNEVCNTITGGKVKKWPIKSKLSASLLTVKYALLHKIGSANWVPTNHTSTIAVGLGRFIYAIGTKTVFDYGTYIFDQIMRHAGTSATKLPIAFPSLICGIILKQYPGILKAKDSVCKRESALTFHYKLLQRTDASTSAGTSQTCKSMKESKSKQRYHEDHDDYRVTTTSNDIVILRDHESVNFVSDERMWDFFTSYTSGEFEVLKMGNNGVYKVICVGDVFFQTNMGIYDNHSGFRKWKKLDKCNFVVARGEKLSKLY
ncbi:uncharacterized protein LOC131598587 [Vicia villosa]|uniref:uncharacterized protein LOC131598587 n=1 Tax=Vicia villosa TaxID=3911 RepID=UPI00273CD97E|nr:uncharacterized protein LOC131598587 [Vicia villosa]